MTQCPQCGAPTKVGQSFCGTCGANLATADAERTVIRPSVPPAEPPIWVARDQPTAQLPVQPPYQPQPQYAAPSTPSHANIDLSWLLKGNWVGAALTAGVALGAALAVSLITAFTTAEDLDVASAFSMTGLLTEATFGVDFTQSSGRSSVYYGHIPTLATLLSLLAAALVFRRVTSRYPSWASALGDGARAALILAMGLTILAIVLKIAEPNLQGYESADDNDIEGFDSFSEFFAKAMSRSGLATGVDGKTTSSMAGAVFLGLILLFLTLFLASFLRRDWLDATSARAHEWLSAPLAGIGALIVGLTAAGLVYVVAIVVGQESARDFNEVVALVAILPSLGMRLLGLGSGAEFGIRVNGDDTDADEESLQRLAGFADDNGALFWLAPVIAIALALGAVYVVILKSSDRSQVQRNVLVYLGLTLVVLPVLIRFANFHLNGEEGDENYSIFGGVDGFQTTMLFLLVSLLSAGVMLLVTGNLDLATLKTKASSFAQSVQTNPGQPAQPGPPPQGPPPGWQQPPPPQQWGPPPQPPPGPPPGWQQPPGPPPQGPPPGPPPQQ